MTVPKECRRILASGARCHALAVKGTPYCFFHQAVREFHRENSARKNSILIPSLEDRASIQLAIMSTLDAIAAGRMDPMRARAYLYGLQLAMQNLGKDREFAVRDSVHNPVCPDDAEFLAPDDEEQQSEIETPRSECSTHTAGSNAAEDGSLCASPVIPQPAAIPESPAAQLENLQQESIDQPIAISAEADISAAADTSIESSAPHPLARYGNLHEWQLCDRELTEDELRKRKIVERIVRNLVKDLLRVEPYKCPRDRRKFREQLYSRYFNQFQRPEPESRQCVVTTRYLAHLLA
jgi:hypothetical protein